MTTVREINDPLELDALRPMWEELLERTPGSSYCQSLDWLQAFWNHYGARKRLRVLVVQDRDQVIGILPLAVWTAHPYEPVKSLTYPLDYWGDYYGPIGPDPAATLAAGLDHIRRTPRDWHFIELAWVDGLADDGRTKRALDGAGFHAICDRVDANPILDLTAFDSWDAYLASRSKNQRKHLRRHEKRLADRGKVTYLRHRTAGTEGTQSEPRWDLYEACETISQASWQGSAPSGTMLTKDVDQGFFRECFERATKHGGVDLDLLYVDEHPVAFGYRYYYRGRVTGVKGAYHPNFANEGAGTVLRARSIAESYARGDHTIEFGDEFLYYKRAWLTHLRPVYRYVHFTRGVPAQLIRGKRAVMRRVRPIVRKWRERTRSPARELASPACEEQLSATV
jgi:CelD/BcsL family acetyltransferase involved in cellulose biosynthesis